MLTRIKTSPSYIRDILEDEAEVHTRIVTVLHLRHNEDFHSHAAVD